MAYIAGSTEKYTSTQGLISAIGVTASSKFVKYGTLVNQASIKEDYTYTETSGVFDIVKELTFTLTNLGSVDARAAVTNLIANPVAALVKLKTGTWIAFGLNGQFMAKTIAGTVDTASNGRVVTLSGSDTEFIQPVDPTIIASLIA
ncbi:hypothetical protein FPZ42_07650 [Mucilaginibacter achroorhodeus]|uniref:Uncharacterized protein n=1 Tax=Mucilaginibacter achroorhodeus TaxID=2599294 RepID=A0A563U6B8_9SPHI|nr:hypothetical protein FPZ42_07650 [Mucilaginibacter achroorhodeus]